MQKNKNNEDNISFTYDQVRLAADGNYEWILEAILKEGYVHHDRYIFPHPWSSDDDEKCWFDLTEGYGSSDSGSDSFEDIFELLEFLQHSTPSNCKERLIYLLEGVMGSSIQELVNAASTPKVCIEAPLKADITPKSAPTSISKPPSSPWLLPEPNHGKEPSLVEICDQFSETVFKGHLIFMNGQFMAYKQGYWALLEQAADVERPLLEFLGKNAKPRRIKEIISLLSMKTALRAESFSNASAFMCLENGALDMTTKQLTEHSPKHFLTNKHPIAWNGTATAPLWIQTLEEIFEPDDDKAAKIQLLQEFIGYCLTPDTHQHKFLWMIGGGANGKSLVLSVIEALVGPPNICHASIESLKEKFVRAELQHKLINISSEMSASATVADGPLKQIVAGDSIQAERKYAPSFSFKPFCRLIGATNELPRLLDHSDGFFRRAIILPFNRKFEEKQQDKSRLDRLLLELPGILNWALIGLQRLQQRGSFEIPSSSVSALARYRIESDPIKMFASEVLKHTDEIRFLPSSRIIYGHYENWCRTFGHRAVSEVAFSNGLERVGYRKTRKSSGVVWQLALAEEFVTRIDATGASPEHLV